MQRRYVISLLLLTAFFISFNISESSACTSAGYTVLSEVSNKDRCRHANSREDAHYIENGIHACDSGCANGCGTDDCDCTCCHGMHIVSAIQQEEGKTVLVPMAGYLSPHIPAYSFEYAFSIWQPPRV